MRYIRGHNSRGMNRSKPWKPDNRWRVEDRGFTTPCWLWNLRVGTAGYGMLGVMGKTYLAHRWHYEQAKGPIPEGLKLDHLCHQKTCVNPDHLEPVTVRENTRRGRSLKLTDDQARDIWQRRQHGESIRSLAEEYGVGRETVRLIGVHGPDGPRRPR